jgi:hypothetical protein
MAYAVRGLRQGVMLSVPGGAVANGRIERAEHIAALRAQGYELHPHDWVDPVESDEDRRGREAYERERELFEKLKGRHRRDLLAPARKASYEF